MRIRGMIARGRVCEASVSQDDTADADAKANAHAHAHANAAFFVFDALGKKKKKALMR